MTYFGLRDYGVVGQIGLEASPAAYVAAMVEVFSEVWRVLRADGTCWLNLGDSYNNFRVSKGPGQAVHGRDKLNGKPAPDSGPRGWSGLKEKDLIGIPWRVAFALQEAGWWLRSDIIWAKRNCMPESVRDRPTRAHEYLFLLAKSERYFYDAVAIEEDGEIAAGTRAAKGSTERAKHANGRPPEYAIYTGKRNKRSVWWIATQPLAIAHFATFPPDLIEPCIRAGTSEYGCCPACGAPWVRVVDSERHAGSSPSRNDGSVARSAGNHDRNDASDARHHSIKTTTGWLPSCTCPAAPPVPATVLDCFGGAGTTGLVADRLGRSAILIELNADYVRMAERRVTGDAPLFAEVSA